MSNILYTIRDLFNYPVESALLIAAIIFSLFCSIRVKTTFGKYNLVRTANGAKAHEVARRILDINGLYDVQIMQVAGNLTDHYNPKTKVLALSETVFGNSTVAAVGVAAHECGHAIQHAKQYTPIMIRQTIYPAVAFCSKAWPFVFIIGCILGLLPVVQIAIGFFIVVALFQLVTLPVEIDASKRAINTLVDNKILYGNELLGARRVLGAAAMTYVSSFLVTLAQLFKLLAKTNRKN